jgi:hypothetical protein
MRSQLETDMRTAELFRSCANEHVAAAAMACVGGALHRRVSEAARGAGLTSGALVARLVADFDRKASPRRRKSLEKSMTRHQTPILAGLRLVVESALEGAWDHAESRSPAALRAGAPWPHAAALRPEETPVKRLHS